MEEMHMQGEREDIYQWSTIYEVENYVIGQMNG